MIFNQTNLKSNNLKTAEFFENQFFILQPGAIYLRIILHGQ